MISLFKRPTRFIRLGTYHKYLLSLSYQVPDEHLDSHMHIIGKSGSGKSNFIASFVQSLFNAGKAVTLIDPHGDLAKLVFARLIEQGTFDSQQGFDRVVYLDFPGAQAQKRFMPFNVLDQDGEDDAIATNVRDAFHRAWPELAAGAAAFDTLLFDSALLLLHHQLPLTDVHRVLTDDAFRAQLLANEPDQYLVDSFRHTYDKLRPYEQVTYAGSLLRRTRLLTQLRILRFGLAQKRMLLNFGDLINNNKTVLVNLAVQNTDARKLLGCLLTVAIEQAALARAQLPPEQRTHSNHVIIDECQMFMAQSEDTFATILSQCRKYRVNLVLAHQNWSQIPIYLRGALQNVGYEFVFKQGRDDAERSAKQVGYVDPMEVKHEIADADVAERSHPTFSALPEQWERWIQRMQYLGKGEAFIRDPDDHVVRVKTDYMRLPALDSEKLSDVESYYLRWCFRAQDEIEQELQSVREGATQPRERVRRFG